MGDTAIDYIEEHRKEFERLAREIWEYPETAFCEYETSRRVADFLEKEGFAVERGVGGLETAVRAVFGEGRPAIGFLGELDALPGLSQKAQAKREPAAPRASGPGNDGSGHGCGHNLVAAGHLAAAVGLKEQLLREKRRGTVVYYGCPGEEAGTGKIYLARAHAFDGLDCFIHFHPGQINTVGISAISSCSARFRFAGVSAHPSINPQDGRSALEGVELMNVGANYLRGHVTKDVSIAYIVADGGEAVNIIPDRAAALYDIRALRRETVFETYRRIAEIAEGAAMMTGTRVTAELLGCTYDLLNNPVFMGLLEACFQNVPVEEYTEEELEFLEELNRADPAYTRSVKEQYGIGETEQIHRGMVPMQENFGSTDVGDVSWIVPGVTFRTACYAAGAEGHSWQSTACSGHPAGMRGMIRAAKIMARFAIEILDRPELLRRAKEEFKKQTEGAAYVCSIPRDAPLPE